MGTAVLSQSHRCQLHHTWQQIFIDHLRSCCFFGCFSRNSRQLAGLLEELNNSRAAALCSDILCKWPLQMYKLTSHLSNGLDVWDQLHQCCKAAVRCILWLCPCEWTSQCQGTFLRAGPWFCTSKLFKRLGHCFASGWLEAALSQHSGATAELK